MGLVSRVLVVDDDALLARALDINLRTRGYEVAVAHDGQSALDMVALLDPQLVLLDLGLPDIDGVDVLVGIRSRSTVPVIVLSARSGVEEKIRTLDAGADDYVTKPFGMAELLARVKAAVGRAKPSEPGDRVLVVTPDFTVDLAARQVLRDGLQVPLTPIEWGLLAILVGHLGKPVTVRQLVVQVWGPAYAAQPHYLRVYMARLRRKLEPDPTHPKYLLTEIHFGYRFAADFQQIDPTR